MAASATLQLVLDVKDQASQQLSQFGKSLDVLKNGADAMADRFKKVSIASGLALTALGAFSVKAIGEFAKAEAAQKQLEHATLDVAHGTREQLKALQDLSSELEKKGVLDGDAIATGLAQLQTFGLTSDMVKQLGGSLADLAVNQFGVNASSEQLTQSANMIAKALQGQFGILEKSGIRFTEAQKALIQFGSESEKAAALQEGFAQNLKFTNEVAKQTTEGGLAALNVQVGNITEAIGGALVPAMSLLLTKIIPIIQKVEDWTAKNPELISKIILITAAVLAFGAVLSPIFVILGNLVTVIQAVGVALAFVAANPIILIIAAVVALGAAIWLLIKNWDAVSAKILEVWAVIVSAVTAAWDTVKGKIDEFMQGVGAAITGAMTSISDFFSTIWTAITGAIVGFFTGALAVIKAGWDGLIAIFDWAFSFILGLLDVFTTVFLGVHLSTLISGAVALFQGFVDGLTAMWQFFTDGLLFIFDAFQAVFIDGILVPFLDGATALWTGFIDGLKAAWTALKTIASTIWGGITGAINAKLDEQQQKMQENGAKIQEIWSNAWTALSTVFTNIFDNNIKPVIQGALDWVTSMLDKIQGLMSGIGSVVGKVGDVIGSGVKSVKSIGDTIRGNRAVGGPVTPGGPYRVGENGPEMFYPSTNGRVGAMSGGTQVSVVVTGNQISNQMDLDELAVNVGDAIIKRLRLNYNV